MRATQAQLQEAYRFFDEEHYTIPSVVEELGISWEEAEAVSSSQLRDRAKENEGFKDFMRSCGFEVVE